MPASRKLEQYLDGLSRLPDLHSHADVFGGAISTDEGEIFGTAAGVLAGGALCGVS